MELKQKSMRGGHLIGVHWHNASKAFKAQVSKSKGKQEHLGSFNTEIEAFKAYKTAKESFIKSKQKSGNQKLTLELIML